MKVFYRLSDCSYVKLKLPGASKQFCLKNFLSCFAKHDVTVIADNCNDSTIEYLQEIQDIEIQRTSLGNSGAFIHALNQACETEGVVYFVEDDYLHLQESPLLIAEGLSVSDYTTLYDHPDKYMDYYGEGEVSLVRRKKMKHWRYTISTCMTFATTAKVIREDRDVWEKYCLASHPRDHEAFVALRDKGRKLAVCIPGAASHVDLTVPGIINWQEPWVIRMLATENIMPADS